MNKSQQLQSFCILSAVALPKMAVVDDALPYAFDDQGVLRSKETGQPFLSGPMKVNLFLTLNFH